MGKEIFQKLYRRLNKEQKEAVDALEGPVMVVAGPGTGKTQILALRICNILRKKKTGPARILALTFSESGVSAMRRRLTELIGRDGYYVPVFTFHGFCNEVIQSHPEEFPRIGAPENLTEVEQINILREVLDATSPKLLRPFGSPYRFINEIRGALSGLKREGIGPEEFSRMVERERSFLEASDDLYHQSGAYAGKMKGQYQDELRRIEKNEELSRVYSAYQGKLRDAGDYDYDDMILSVAEKLQENELFRLRLHDRYDFILVDEHQDTNNAQNKVIQLLLEGKEPANLFIVGDEKQAIYRFQGASLDNFLYFHHLFPEVKFISLHKNYRSGRSLLSAASALAEHNSSSITRVLPQITEELEPVSPGKTCGAGPQILQFATEEEEDYFIAQEIEKLLRQGADPKEVAVLAREHRDAEGIADLLRKRNIPFAWERQKAVTEDYWAEKALRVLDFLADFGNEEKLLPVLHIPVFNFSSLDIFKLYAQRSDPPQKNVLELMRDNKKFSGLFGKLESWHKMAQNEPPLRVLEGILWRGGFLAAMKNNPAGELQGIKALFRQLRQYVRRNPCAGLRDLLNYIYTLEENNVRLKVRSAPREFSAVQIMSAHGAKGLEFDYVFVPRCHDAKWGGRRRPEFIKITPRADDRYEDERRAFFVALTRARKIAHLSYALTDSEGRNLVPSIFLSELSPSFVQHREVESFSSAPDSAAAGDRFKNPEKQKSKKEITAWVKEIFARRGFSATALNNYLQCPWKYFYINLLLVPRLPAKQQMYGSAVHEALKEFFESVAVPGTTTVKEKKKKNFLLKNFETALKKQMLSSADFQESLEKGREVLDKYYDHYFSSWNFNVRNEVSLQVPLQEDLLIKGKIDKLEILDEDNNVVVVDYKTGRPKTRGQIEGTTKDSNGDLKRQLVFYKFLLDKYDPVGYKMQAAELDFVEPDRRGKFRKERFIISDQETKEMEQTILRAAKEVRALSFWNQRCQDRECLYCKLQQRV